MVKVVSDGGFQLLCGAEAASANLLLGERGKPSRLPDVALLHQHGQHGTADNRTIDSRDGVSAGRHSCRTSTSARGGFLPAPGDWEQDRDHGECRDRHPKRSTRRLGTAKNNMLARASPPPLKPVKSEEECRTLAVVDATVEMVTVAVCAAVPVMWIEAGTEQVGVLDPPAPIRTQVWLTVPPKPLVGVTLRVAGPD